MSNGAAVTELSTIREISHEFSDNLCLIGLAVQILQGKRAF